MSKNLIFLSKILEKTSLFLVTIFLSVFTQFFLGYRGMFNETVHIELSLDRPNLDSFFYPYNKFRIFMQVPYKLALLISDHSYSGVIAINILLTIFNLLFFYLIIKTLFRLRKNIAILGMSIFAFFSADATTLSLSMLVVKFSTLFYLISVYIFIKYRNIYLKFILIVACQVISILTYDAILIFMAFSFILIILSDLNRKIVQSTIWVSTPIIILTMQIYITRIKGEDSYQSNILNLTPNILEILISILKLGYYSLFFPAWPRLQLLRSQILNTQIDLNWIIILLYLSISLMFIYFIWKYCSPKSRFEFLIKSKSFLVFMIIFLASVIPYVFVNNNFSQGFPNRSLLHSSVPGSIIVFLIYLIFILRTNKIFANIFISTYFVFASATLGIDQVLQKQKWNSYINVMSEIKKNVPDVEQGTLILLFESRITNESFHLKNVFSSNIWFNSALQLAYPQKKLVGAFFSSDGQLAPDIELNFQEDEIEITYSNVGVEKEVFNYKEIIILRFQNERISKLSTIAVPSREYLTLKQNYKLILMKDESRYTSPLLGEILN